MDNRKYKIGLIILGIVITYLIIGHVVMIDIIKSERMESMSREADLISTDCKATEVYSNIAIVTFENHKYNVELIVQGTVGTVWLRSTEGKKVADIRAYSMFASMTSLESAKVEICRSKKEFEDGKGFAGCLATAGAAGCAFGTMETVGAMVPMCVSVWEYTFSTGLADCITNISEKIAEKYLSSKEISARFAITAASRGQFKNGISSLIDIACDDVNKQAESEKEKIKDTPTKEPNPVPGPRPSEPREPVGNRPEKNDNTKIDKDRSNNAGEKHPDKSKDPPAADKGQDKPKKESNQKDGNDSGGGNTEPKDTFGGGTLGLVQDSHGNSALWVWLVIIIGLVGTTYLYIFYRRTPKQ